jgi:plastocyanin
MKHRVPIAFAALCMIAALGACSKSNTSGTGDPSDTPDAVPPTVSVTASEPAPGEYAFEVGDMPSGAFTIEFSNEGSEPHDFQLVAATEGHTLEELLEEVGSEDAPVSEWVEAAGGVGQRGPGSSGAATLDLEAGDYWYFCTVSGETGSHAANGMAGEVTLGEDSGAELPETTMSIELFDYGFTESGLTADETELTVTNTGEQIHHVIFAPMAEDATLDTVTEFFQSEGEPSGPPPVDFEGAVGTAVIAPGQTIVADLDFEAGTSYAMACFMSDYEVPGPPHVAKGMLDTTEIA